MKTLQDTEKVKKVSELYQQVTNANKDYFQFWKENTFLHWDFWLSFLFMIIPILFWIKFRKKNSSNRLLFVGLFVVVITSWFDFLGVQFGLWYYTGKVIPSIPSYIPWDFVIFPIFIMSLIQIKPKLSPFIKGVIFASTSAFIGEPLFIWLGFYKMTGWHLYYSFPIYIVIYLLAHKLSKVSNFDPIN